MKYLPLLSLLFISLFSCQKEEENPCPETFDHGSFSLGESAKAFLPYENGKTAIFVDIDSNELAFNIQRTNSAVLNGEFLKECNETFGDERVTRYMYTTTGTSVSLYNQDKDIQINLDLFALPNPSITEHREKADLLKISFYWQGQNRQEESPYSYGIPIEKRSYLVDDFPISKIRFFTLNNKYYEKGIIAKTVVEDNLLYLYYNEEHGILRFEEPLDHNWFFDRFE